MKMKRIVALALTIGLFGVGLCHAAQTRPLGSLAVDRGDGIGDVAIDTVTRSMVFGSIHEKATSGGGHYFVGLSTTLPKGTTCEIILKSPDSDVRAHVDFKFEVIFPTTFTILEGSTFTFTGTTTTPLNSNRDSANSATVGLWISSGTGGVTGTELYNVAFYGTNAGIGIPRTWSKNGLVLHRNQTYIYKFISDRNDNVIPYEIKWSEID